MSNSNIRILHMYHCSNVCFLFRNLFIVFVDKRFIYLQSWRKQLVPWRILLSQYHVISANKRLVVIICCFVISKWIKWMTILLINVTNRAWLLPYRGNRSSFAGNFCLGILQKQVRQLLINHSVAKTRIPVYCRFFGLH